MSYIKIPLIKYNNTLRRPYYIAEIINTGKNIINFTEPTQFDVNILSIFFILFKQKDGSSLTSRFVKK